MLLIDDDHQVEDFLLDSPYSVEEESVLLVLTAIDSGISLMSVEFQPNIKSDEVLLSSYLATFRSMSDLMFHLSLDEIRFGGYTLLMKIASPFLISYIFRGRPHNVIQKLNVFVNNLLESPSIIDSFWNTISTGAVNQNTKSFVECLANQIFTNSREQI